MDRERFDDLARLVWTQRSRRDALSVLVGAALIGHSPGHGLADRKRKHQRGKGKGKGRNQKGPCFPGTSCAPGAGQDASGCDFSRSTRFVDLNVSGADLSNSSFFAADLRGADFRGASLRGGCFLAANLLGATIDASVNLTDAVFCQTVMPDGTLDSSGCDKATGCCSDCPGGVCGGWDGCTPIENLCNVPFGRPCCPNSSCEKVVQSKFSPTTCQSASCHTNEECAARFPHQDVSCETNTYKCSGFRSSCCLPKTCDFQHADRDCPHSGNCCGFGLSYQCCAPGQLCSPTGCYGATRG